MQVFERFMEFVRGKPADEPYNGMDPYNCALAQFALKVEKQDFECISALKAGNTGYWVYTPNSERYVQVIPLNSWGVPKGMDALMYSKTFGELLTALEKIQK